MRAKKSAEAKAKADANFAFSYLHKSKRPPRAGVSTALLHYCITATSVSTRWRSGGAFSCLSLAFYCVTAASVSTALLHYCDKAGVSQ